MTCRPNGRRRMRCSPATTGRTRPRTESPGWLPGQVEWNRAAAADPGSWMRRRRPLDREPGAEARKRAGGGDFRPCLVAALRRLDVEHDLALVVDIDRQPAAPTDRKS